MDILKNRMKLKDLSVNIYSLHDKIKSPHHLPASMIINSDTSEFGDGEHWVSIYVDTDKNVFYFDTFGVILDPVYQNIASWGSSFRPMIYNKKHIQHPFSTLCGSYCVMFVGYMYNGLSFLSFLNIFGNDYKVNDTIVRNFISKIK